MASQPDTSNNAPPRTTEARSTKAERPVFPSISFVLFALAIIAAGSGAAAWVLVRPEQRSVEIIIPTPGPVVVHVTGDVPNPGVYTLPPGSRASDAVHAAGGLSEPSNINLAAELIDGQQLVVTAADEGVATQREVTEARSAGSPDILLDLNTASASQLEQLPNIGPSRAAAIVSFRERNGPLLFVDDLTAIDGIGPATVDGLRSLVVQP